MIGPYSSLHPLHAAKVNPQAYNHGKPPVVLINLYHNGAVTGIAEIKRGSPEKSEILWARSACVVPNEHSKE
jgi:hypothetical protein